MTKKESEEEKINTAALYHGPKSDVGSVFFVLHSRLKSKGDYLLKDVAAKLWNFLSLD